MLVFSMRLLALNVSSRQTSSGTHSYDPSLEKCSTLSIVLESSGIILTCFIVAKVWSDPKWSISSISNLELTNLHFQVLTDIQIVYRTYGGTLIFQPTPTFPPMQWRKSVDSKCSYGLHNLIPPAQTIPVKARHTVYIYFLNISSHSRD